MQHPAEHEIELYCLGRMTHPEQLARFEEHFLICPQCQDRIRETDEFVSAIRDALQTYNTEGADTRVIEIIAMHFTNDGNIYLWIVQRPWGQWFGRVSGKHLDSARGATSFEQAVSVAEEQFWEMFPEHVCGPRCVSGSTRRRL